MADFTSIYNAIANAKCTHQGCESEPVMFVYSKLTKRATPQCAKHGGQLLLRGAYTDLDEMSFLNGETEVA